MRARGSSLLFILLVSSSVLVISTPCASAQSLEEVCNSNTLCIAVGAIFLVFTIYSYYRKNKDAEKTSQNALPGDRPPMTEPVPRGYEQTPSYGTTPYPSSAPGYTSAPQPQGTPGYTDGPQPQGVPGITYAPQPQGAPGYSSAPQPQDIPGYPTAPDIPGTPRDYTPVMVVEEPRRRKKASAPGACPRCGSKNIQSFDTGEHKCLDCKKIYLD